MSLRARAMTDQPATPTPGPWHIAVVEPRTLGMKHQVRVYANTGMDCHVANCFGPNPDRVIDIDKIARANARLIAAAPDLLAALIYADLQLRDHGQVDPKVRAAIAEATP